MIQSIAVDSTCFTNREGVVNVSEMRTIVINGAGASAGDLFMSPIVGWKSASRVQRSDSVQIVPS
jgi:hypothetical protein